MFQNHWLLKSSGLQSTGLKVWIEKSGTQMSLDCYVMDRPIVSARKVATQIFCLEYSQLEDLLWFDTIFFK